MQTKQHAHRKTLIKTELAMWHWLGRLRSNTRIILASVLFGVLAIGGITLTTAMLESSPAQPLPASSYSPPQHVAKHAAPHSEHVSQKPVTAPGTHLAKYPRDYVIVRSGDSLWSLAQKYLHDPYKWTYLAQRNHLSSPETLHIGQRIWL